MLTVTHSHILHLDKALLLAEQRKGFCSPNPAVGAIVLQNGEVIAEGTHWKAGDPHAEVVALSNLSPQDTEGATLYVTLEPCSHTGKTPPCVDLLIKHKLKAVYYGLEDPNPLVSGKGKEKLLQAGISCEYIPYEKIDTFYQSYIWWTENKRPWVTAKLALSLDGKIAGPKGSPRRITGEALHAYTHQCRMATDAILTTVKTIINDDPQMNARVNGTPHKKPIYIIDARLDTPVSARIFETASSVSIFHLQRANPTRKKVLIEQEAHCVPIPEIDGKLNLDDVMDYIGKEGVHDLWVEAGGTCFQALLLEQLLHHILLYFAPKTLGSKALAAFSANGDIFDGMRQITWRQYGHDAMCEMFPFRG